jgi:hypothetical protein
VTNNKSILLYFTEIFLLLLLFSGILSLHTSIAVIYAQLQTNIAIQSPASGITVQPGVLTINGQSRDSTLTNCVVYGHYNNLMQNAIPNGANDYSSWRLTFNLAQIGFNDIRVELSCPGLASSYDNIIVYVTAPPPPTQPNEDVVSNEASNGPSPVAAPPEDPIVGLGGSGSRQTTPLSAPPEDPAPNFIAPDRPTATSEEPDVALDGDNGDGDNGDGDNGDGDNGDGDNGEEGGG